MTAEPRRESPLIARGISKSFRAGEIQTTILEDVSLEVYPARLTLIAGPSGCGKSTLLAIMSGLLRVDGGEVIALGEDLGRMDAKALVHFRLQHTGFVFQEFGLFPALTAQEQVELPLHYLGLPRREQQRRASQAIDEVGLQNRRQLKPAALSGGEKQRVAIARALAKAPALLFADEPTSALDAENGAIVIDLLHRIARVHGTTVLCVSHDPRVTSHVDRVLTMEDGQILEDHRLTSVLPPQVFPR
jgi:putative ABC transport system ATP-binding protein